MTISSARAGAAARNSAANRVALRRIGLLPRDELRPFAVALPSCCAARLRRASADRVGAIPSRSGERLVLQLLRQERAVDDLGPIDVALDLADELEAAHHLVHRRDVDLAAA